MSVLDFLIFGLYMAAVLGIRFNGFVDLHPSAYGIAASCVVFVIGSYLFPDRNDNSQKGEIGV